MLRNAPVLHRPVSSYYPAADDNAGAAAGGSADGVLLEQLMDLLDRPLYTMSGPDLDELLQVIEVLVAPLANLKQVRDGNAVDMYPKGIWSAVWGWGEGREGA